MEKKKAYGAASAAILSYAIMNAIIQVPDIIDLINEDKSFVYELNNDDLEVSGRVKRDVALSWFLVEGKKDNGESQLSVINKDGIDVLTNEFVTEVHKIDDSFVSLDENILSMEKFSSYLMGDEDLEYYTPDDIVRIINLIANNYNWHTEKTLKIAY